MPAPARRPSMISLVASLSASLILVGCDPPKKQAKTREILNQRTTDIRDAPAEIEKGAEVTTPRVPIADPITQAGNTYVNAISRTSQLQIEQAINLYHATTGEYPKDYNQFKEEVMKPNNIALPTLPSGLEYGYDAAQHKLVILKVPGTP